MKIAEGIHQLKLPIADNPLGYINCYLVEGKEGWLMVDTGWHTEEAFRELETGLRELGLTLTDISTIVVTHVHPDHYGLAGRIKQGAPQARLLAHRWEWDFIESRYIRFADVSKKIGAMLKQHGIPPQYLPSLQSASMPALRYVTITLPDEPLWGGETLSTGTYELETIWTPGHSPGHLCLYEPRNRLLFSGDHILPDITPNVSYHVQSGDNPLGDYISSVRKLEHLEVAAVLPGHQRIFNDLPGRIQQLLRHHEARKQAICQAIEKGLHTAYDIAARIPWNVPDLTWDQFPPLARRGAVMETIAHLECLRWEGKVKRAIQDGLITYSLR